MKYGIIDADNIDEIIRKEIGLTFKEILECAGVFKRDTAGKDAFSRFVSYVNEK